MNNKNIKNLFIFVGILLVFLVGGCVQQQTKYVCPDGTSVSDSSLCLTSEDINFKAFWRNTNPTCQQAGLREISGKNVKVGELSFTFYSSKRLDYGKCKLFVNDVITDAEFFGNVDATANAYMGKFEAVKDHIVKVCCGGNCKESLVTRLCNE